MVGGYYGKGKRTNVYGAFLLACYDSDSEEFQTICKIGTGFSEEVLKSNYDVLKPLELTKPRGDIKQGGANPDVWFEPKIVWEVLTADLSLSPVYTAAQGLVSEESLNSCGPLMPFGRWMTAESLSASPASSVFAMTKMPMTPQAPSR